MVMGAVIIGVVSGKAIFGPPLDEYWKKKLEEEAAAKETGSGFLMILLFICVLLSQFVEVVLGNFRWS
ncbi:hypothetical protein Csa_006142 [Cucumis sativus]|nr:hypothetical protein Csa_006142 [Cucumis sativus]